MSFKSELSCNICKLVVNKPVTLPCSSVVCGEHLHDASVKNGMIKCQKCDKEFDVPRSGFPSNERVANILANDHHLNDEEIAIKNAIQELIQKLDQLQNDVRLKRNDMEITSFDHFTEIRRQIDIQREELKNKIDEISLKLIDRANEIENAYKLKLTQSVSVVLDADIKQFSHSLMREFRDPNLLIDKVKCLQIEHEQNVQEFQARISDIDSLSKEIKSYEFAPRQEFQENGFGSLKMKGRLIACTLDNNIQIWNINTGECVNTLIGHSSIIEILEKIDENRFASVSMDGEIRIWNASSFTCLKIIYTHSPISGHGHCLTSLSLNIIACSFKFVIQIWDIESGERLKTLNGHSDWVSGLICLPNGYLASCSLDNSIKVWDLDRGECLKTIECDSIFRCVILLKNGNLASCSEYDSEITIWNVETGERVQSLQGHSDDVWRLQVQESGELISCSHDKTIKIWNIHEKKCIRTLEGHTDIVNSIRIYSQTSTLASCAYDGTIKTWDLKTGECIKTIVLKDQCENVIIFI